MTQTKDGASPTATGEPLALFQAWYADAVRAEPNDPDAMALATANARGEPSVRMVLLKGADARGFVFYTNMESRKGEELLANPQASLCFHWKSLRRQVRVDGTVSQVSAEEADAYFASRARASQIGAWASQQSRPLDGRWDLERRVASSAVRFGFGTVPRPPHWSGFRVCPRAIEFWEDRPFRLHDRRLFQRPNATAPWTLTHLFP